MSADLLRQALVEIQSSGIEAEAKAAAVKAVYAVARRNGLPSFERDEQIAFAQHLLSKRVERRLIAARLMACFSIERSTAYERIAKALQLSRKQPGFRTAQALNVEVGPSDQPNKER